MSSESAIGYVFESFERLSVQRLFEAPEQMASEFGPKN